jgi:hypothetical protein
VTYVKDLDGRYLHVNSRYLDFFDVAAADVRGRRDSDLTPRQTVDGPRIASGSISEEEPLQLEYTVAPFEGRPALAVWRFAVRAEGGDTVAVCGVAAPVADAALARRECERLMAAVHETESRALENAAELRTEESRIAALHEASASTANRAHELLTELTEERQRRTEAETRAAESDELRRRLDAAEAAALAERARAEEAEMAAQHERERVDAANAAVLAERAQAERAMDSRNAVRAQLEALQAELASARAQLQIAPAGELVDDLRRKLAQAEATAHRNRQRADAAEAALNAERADAEIRVGVAERRIAELEGSLAEARAQVLEADTQRPAAGPTWDSSAQRAFTTALSQSSDWRVSVKSAIGVIGSRGGWDAVCAWQPDDRGGFASCFAMWTGENHRLGALETATWQRRQPLNGSTIGDALTSEESRWLAADPRAADRRLQLLAQHGIRGALIVPVKDGARPVAALELLTVGATQPSGELIDAIDTTALQLGHFWHLLSAGAQPRWRFGRA